MKGMSITMVLHGIKQKNFVFFLPTFLNDNVDLIDTIKFRYFFKPKDKYSKKTSLSGMQKLELELKSYQLDSSERKRFEKGTLNFKNGNIIKIFF